MSHCQHYKGDASRGRCREGLYGGRVTPSLCKLMCPVYARDATGGSPESVALRDGITPTVSASPRRKSGGCCGGRKDPAERVEPVRWLGLTWIGEPWPRRLRPQWPVRVRPASGCGCIAVLKRWAEARRLRRFGRDTRP